MIRVAVLATMLTLTVLLGGLAAPAGAQTSGGEVDACTGVPDAGQTFDFTGACLAHDDCYDERPYGDDAAGRKRCDQDLLDDARAWCNDSWPGRSNFLPRATCKGVAWTYYLGVRLLGGFGY